MQADIQSPAALEAALRFGLDAAIDTGAIPGVSIAVLRGGGPAEHLILGTDATGRPLTEDSIFPVASITKLATALALLRLAGAGAFALDDDLAQHLPNAAAARPGVTLRALLSHTAGLPPDLPDGAAPYTWGLDWPALARACLATTPERPPTTRVGYSNLGYGLLAIVVERCTGQRFATVLHELVFGPLGVEAYLGEEPPRPPVVVAGVGSPHTGSPLEPYNSAFWRSLALPWGGMLTTAAGALALLRAFRGDPDGFVHPDVLAQATRDQTGGLEMVPLGAFAWSRCPWGLGAELRGVKQPHWAPLEAGSDSFGHAGASGCVVWTAPSSDLTWAVLSARAMRLDTTDWLVHGGPAIGRTILDLMATPPTQTDPPMRARVRRGVGGI